MTQPIPSPSLEPAERDPRAPEVLRVLLDNHARFLSFLERRVGSREEAEDILQEAFVRSVDRAGSLRDAESATAWFYRVLRNAVIDHYRREGSRSRAVERLAAEAAEAAKNPTGSARSTRTASPTTRSAPSGRRSPRTPRRLSSPGVRSCWGRAAPHTCSPGSSPRSAPSPS